jgi:FkbM family methyltransferase
MFYILKRIIKKLLRPLGFKLIRIGPPYTPNPYSEVDLETLNCMNKSKGIMHLGAHKGTEAEVYNWFGKKVIWFEAVPHIFDQLKDNLYFYSDQKAFHVLLGDQNNIKKDFFISNNDSASSSLFNFTNEIIEKGLKGRKLYMEKKITLKMFTLDTILKNNNISPEEYNHWVVDLQGSELLAFKGAEDALKSCNSISVEVSKVQYYEGGVLWNELVNWLNEKNFYSNVVSPEKNHTDILFKKKNVK